jgi:alcohol dehydrogenase (cytochrome c)
VLYLYWNQFVPIAALAINYVRYLSAPAGTIETETAPGQNAAAAPAVPATTGAVEGDWPSYNKTLTSNRFSAAQSNHQQQCRQTESPLHL